MLTESEFVRGAGGTPGDEKFADGGPDLEHGLVEGGGVLVEVALDDSPGFDHLPQRPISFSFDESGPPFCQRCQ